LNYKLKFAIVFLFSPPK